mmetsp:Transcript_11219/g.35608  ORF Transcript_11219/g.35608 Transcript_11219/m.35608 type:complete len:421 (+) Transcript_11219:605-1867(+)
MGPRSCLGLRAQRRRGACLRFAGLVLGEGLVLEVDGLACIVARRQGQGHVPDLEVDQRPLCLPAVHLPVIARLGVQQGTGELVLQRFGKVLRHGEERGACVDDGPALAILAEVHSAVADAQLSDGHLPIAELGESHRGPAHVGEHELWRVAAEGDLAGLLVGIGQKHSEAGLQQAPLCRHHAEEAELRRQRQAVQAEAEDAIKSEGVEGLVRHLCGRDKAELHAVGPMAVRVLARILAKHGGLGRRQTALRDQPAFLLRAQAQSVVHKLAGDLPGTEGYGDLVARGPGRDGGAVVVHVHCVEGQLPAVAPVDGAGLAEAGLRGDDDVARSGVKDHGELLLLGRAHRDGSEVDALVGDGVCVALHGHPLPVQGDDEAPGWRARGAELLGRPRQTTHAGSQQQQGRRREREREACGPLLERH